MLLCNPGLGILPLFAGFQSALWVEIESLEGALDATSENVAAVERLVGAVGGWRVVIREASAPAS